MTSDDKSSRKARRAATTPHAGAGAPPGSGTKAPTRDGAAAAAPPRRDVTAAALPPTEPETVPAPEPGALRTAEQVRAVAHLLSDAADAYNQRLKAEAPRLSSGEVFARLQEEQRLRGIANQLFFEASERTLADAVDAQDTLEATLRDAHARLVEFERFQHALALVADLLVLGGAIVARKGSTVIAALKEVRADLAAATTDPA